MKKKLALILVCVAAVIAIIAVAWIMREKEQPIVPLFPETVDTVPSGFSHIDSVLEEFDSSYVFWETQISIFDKTGVCIYQTDASDSSFIVECNGEYYINASVIEDAMHVNVTEPVVTTAPAEPTETAETTSAEIISTEVTTEEIKITAEPAVLEEVDKLPDAAENAIVEAHPVGGNPSFFVFEKGLTYYVQVLNDPITREVASITKCTLSLPNGYTGGKIIGGLSGAGSGEVILSVLAKNGGKTVCFDYLFYCDNLAEPEWIWKKEGPVFASLNSDLTLEIIEFPIADGAECIHYEYSDRYQIFLTYEGSRFDSVYVIDLEACDVVYTATIDLPFDYLRETYDDARLVLYSYDYIDGEDKMTYALAFEEKGGSFSHSEITLEYYPKINDYITSPDGKHAAWQIITDDAGNGGIDVQYHDGSVKRISQNVRGGDLAKERGYGPFGFIDDTHLLYWISGYEWSAGYGIYDFETDKYTEVLDGSSLKAVGKDAFYTATVYDYADTELYRHVFFGEKELIASRDTNDGVFLMKNGHYYEFNGSVWCEYERNDTGEESLYYDGNTHAVLYTEDFDSDLGEIIYPYMLGGNLFVYGGKVMVVCLTTEEPEETVVEEKEPPKEFDIEKTSSVEDYFGGDVLYKADFDGDGEKENCIVRILGHGTQCYVEEIEITRANGEKVVVEHPTTATGMRTNFYKLKDSYSVYFSAGPEGYTDIVYPFDRLSTAEENLIDPRFGDIFDYSVIGDKLYFRGSLACGFSEVMGDIIYEYTYQDGALKVSHVWYMDYINNTASDIGDFEKHNFLLVEPCAKDGNNITIPDGDPLVESRAIMGNPTFLVYEKGLTYYVKQYTSSMHDEYTLKKYTLSLPEGYTDGVIIDGGIGGGSGELGFAVHAKNGERDVVLCYLFYGDKLVAPVEVWEDNGSAFTPDADAETVKIGGEVLPSAEFEAADGSWNIPYTKWFNIIAE